jgi:predicted nuclease of restriction endonuclease-like (RecB) superfamily
MSEALYSNKEYKAWVKELKERIRSSQIRAAVRANDTMLQLYWSIGADIVERQEAKGWGSKVIPQLSKDLRAELPGIEGFSESNLGLMKRFYVFYSNFGTNLVPKSVDSAISYQPGAKLLSEGVDTLESGSEGTIVMPSVFAAVPWRQHVEIFRHCKTEDEAVFYMRKTVENGWSRGVLMNMMDANLYAAQGKAITNFSQILPNPQSELAGEVLKDPYNFDFVELREGYIEKELEDALAANITKFLLELGQGFAFVGQQVMLHVGEHDAFTDLLFYHLKLRCYIVIELKATEFKAEYMGQLGLYVSAINHLMKTDADKPTIGLLICKSKDNVMAEWSLESSSQPIGISAYELSDLIPEDYKSSLPSIEEIEAQLTDEA